MAEALELAPPGRNPCRAVRPVQGGQGKRFFTPDEYRELGRVLKEADGLVQPSAVAALRLLMLTGCRKNEIVGLRWDDVDRVRALLQPEAVEKPTVASLKLVPAMQPSTIIDDQQVAGQEPDTLVTEPHGKQALEELQGPTACTCRTHQRIPGREIEPLAIPHRGRLKRLSGQLRRHMLLDFPEGFGLVAHQCEHSLSIG